MTTFQKKILFTTLPFIIGFVVSYAIMAFVAWNRDAGAWEMTDRMFTAMLSWVLGGMLYVRFEYDRVR